MNLKRPRPLEFAGMLAFLCILLALLYVPIPLGSNRPHAWLAWQMLIYGTLGLWAIGALWGSGRDRLMHPAPGILAAFFVWLALILIQTIEMPRLVVATVSPLASTLQQSLALISVEAPSTLSVDPGNTYGELLKYGSYVAVFALVLATVTTKTRLLTMVAVIILAGMGEAMFGIYSYATGYIIFPEPGSGGDIRVGTFVNRNHFANLLTMVLCLAVGVLVSVINAQPAGRRLQLARYSDSDTGLFMILVVAMLILVAGVLLSGSRAPVVLFFISFCLMLLVTRSGRGPTTGELVLAPVIVLGAAVFLVTIGFDDSVIRLLDRQVLGGERMQQNLSGLDLLAAVWTSGVGAGNYRWVFPMFRGDELRFVAYDYAHNDYLQTAIEQGIPAAMILAAAVVLILRELYRGYKYRKNALLRGVIFGCLLSMIFMLLHALVEFNFRIPANAAYFFVIAAIGLAACRIDRGRMPSRRAGITRKTADE